MRQPEERRPESDNTHRRSENQKDQGVITPNPSAIPPQAARRSPSAWLREMCVCGTDIWVDMRMHKCLSVCTDMGTDMRIEMQCLMLCLAMCAEMLIEMRLGESETCV